MIPRKLLDEIEMWIKEKRFGHLQINFNEGRIVNINKVQSVKVTQLGEGFVGHVSLTSITESNV